MAENECYVILILVHEGNLFLFVYTDVGSGSNCVYFCFEYFYFVPKCLYIVMTIVSYESEGRIS